MRVNSFLVVLGAVQGVLGQAGCNADNCLRAVRMTLPRGSADCSSFLQATVTASATTITRTVTGTSSPSATSFTTVVNTLSSGTVTSTALTTTTVTPLATITTTTSTETSVVNSVILVRQNAGSPKSVPTYASACSGAVRYSSACSCLGVTATSTMTVPGPTSYTTISQTSTLPTVVVVNTETLSTTVPETSTTQTIVATTTAETVTSTIAVGDSTTITSTSTSTTSIPVPTPFCLRGTGNTVLVADYPTALRTGDSLLFAKTVGTYGPPLATVRFTLDSAGFLTETLLGLRVGITAPYVQRNYFRLVNPATAGLTPLVCSGVIGGTLSCTATPPSGATSFVYDKLMRERQAGLAAIGSALDTGGFPAITYTLSTECP